MLYIALIVWGIAAIVWGIAACIHQSKKNRPEEDATVRLALLVRLLEGATHRPDKGGKAEGE